MRWVGWEGKRPTRYGIRTICARLMIGDTLFEHILRNRQTIKKLFSCYDKASSFFSSKSDCDTLSPCRCPSGFGPPRFGPPSPNPLADIDPPGPLADLDPPTDLTENIVLNVLVEIDNALRFSA